MNKKILPLLTSIIIIAPTEPVNQLQRASQVQDNNQPVNQTHNHQIDIHFLHEAKEKLENLSNAASVFWCGLEKIRKANEYPADDKYSLSLIERNIHSDLFAPLKDLTEIILTPHELKTQEMDINEALSLMGYPSLMLTTDRVGPISDNIALEFAQLSDKLRNTIIFMNQVQARLEQILSSLGHNGLLTYHPVSALTLQSQNTTNTQLGIVNNALNNTQLAVASSSDLVPQQMQMFPNALSFPGNNNQLVPVSNQPNAAGSSSALVPHNPQQASLSTLFQRSLSSANPLQIMQNSDEMKEIQRDISMGLQADRLYTYSYSLEEMQSIQNKLQAFMSKDTNDLSLAFTGLVCGLPSLRTDIHIEQILTLSYRFPLHNFSQFLAPEIALKMLEHPAANAMTTLFTNILSRWTPGTEARFAGELITKLLTNRIPPQLAIEIFESINARFTLISQANTMFHPDTLEQVREIFHPMVEISNMRDPVLASNMIKLHNTLTSFYKAIVSQNNREVYFARYNTIVNRLCALSKTPQFNNWFDTIIQTLSLLTITCSDASRRNQILTSLQAIERTHLQDDKNFIENLKQELQKYQGLLLNDAG